MKIAERISKRSKELVLNPVLMKWLSDDRVMRAAESVMDARIRVKAAWKVLRSSHALPPVDPALDDHIGEDADRPRRSNGKSKPANGHARSTAAINGSINGAIDGPVNGREALDLRHSPVPREETPDTNGARLDSDRPESGRSDSEPPQAPEDAEGDLDESLKGRTTLAGIGGKDVFEKCFQFHTADRARKRGLYPFFRPLDFNDGPEAVIDGKRVLMFGSNNYLGLTKHPKVRAAAQAAIDRFGTSMTGSRLVNGSMKLHNEFETKLAAFFNKEAALVFTTGYQVNLAVCSAILANKKTVAIMDRNVHASLYDGARLGQAAGTRLVRYKHSDPGSLDQALSRLDDTEGAFVFTDGVFSAEGEIAKLDEIVPIVKKHGARLLVDDAHALGVIGPGGRGTAYHFGVQDQVDLISGTFSKSMASIGGWLVGERKVLDYIQHFAPSFMFAASAAPPCVAAAMTAFDVMQEEPWRIDKLRENFTYMRTELRRLGFELGRTETAVIPIYIRHDLRTLMMWRELLEEHGVYTNPFISPGVPPKHAMLRTSYMATHSRDQLDRGLEALAKAGKKFGVI